MKKAWSTLNAPRPAGRIAQVSRADDLGIAYISGLISQKPDGEAVTGTSVAEQTHLILKHLKRIMEDMGLTMEHVIKTNIFIRDMADFDEMNQVYIQYFPADNPPARQCVQAGVWGGLDVEISAEAVLR